MTLSLLRLSLPLLLLAMGAGLAGCNETLVYGEETGFNLAIQVNDDPKTPIQVNTGLKRTVGQMTPPIHVNDDDDGSGTKAEGDAVNTFSGFRLNYTKDGFFGGDLTIRTQFATGNAAAELSSDPVAAATFMHTDYDRPITHVSDENIARVTKITDAIADPAKLGDDKAKLLACNPPLQTIDAKNAAEMDPTCQRTASADAARQYLLFIASMSDRNEEQLAAWETALGIQ